MGNLDIVESQLKVGQIKTIKTGNITNLIELLVGVNTKARFYYDEASNDIEFEVSDVNLDIPSLQCVLKKDTVKDMITSLKLLYNQLTDEGVVM